MKFVDFDLVQFFGELLRRKVVRVAMGYAIISWVLLQIGEVTFDPLNLPDWSLSLLVVLLGLGFPVAIVLAWAFEVTPEGVHPDPGFVDQHSVAVLPFADMSSGQDQGYFCDGVAEEILNLLSQVKALRVPARTSSFRFKEQDIDIRTIGDRLNVRAVLEGSVRREDDTLRITTQLINVADGYHLWSETFDRDMHHIFDVQREIATSVLNALHVTLGLENSKRGWPEITAQCDVKAHEYYLRGRHYLNRFSLNDIGFALNMFQKAVERDAKCALGWAGIAEAHVFLCAFSETSEAHQNEALKASEEALALAPMSAICHTARGGAYLICGEHSKAAIEFEAALDGNPKQFEATYYYARNCVHQGEMEKAAGLFERAARANPDDYQSPLLLVSIYRGLGQKQKAAEAARRGIARAQSRLELHPDEVRALYLGCSALLQLGESEKAKQWAEQALAIKSDDAIVDYNIACFYAQAGQIEDALTCLEKAKNLGVSRSWMINDEDLAPLRGNPRFDTGLLELSPA